MQIAPLPKLYSINSIIVITIVVYNKQLYLMKEFVRLRVSVEDKLFLKNEAQKFSMTVSSYLRKRVLNTKIKNDE